MPDAYDNWKTSPPEAKDLGPCDHCAEMVNDGEPRYVVDDDEIVHEDCFLDFAMSKLNAVKIG